MNNIKKLSKVAFVLLVLVATSCAGNSSKKENNNQTTTEQQASALKVLEVDELLRDAEQYAGKEVSVEAVCTHICQHGGRKIFLMGSDDTKTIRVESGFDKAFSTDCVNSMVVVKGILKEQRMNEASLQKWEDQLKAAAAEAKSNSHESCDSEKKARGETANTAEGRIKDFRERLAKRQAEEGKDYLSFYFLEADSYEIQS